MHVHVCVNITTFLHVKCTASEKQGVTFPQTQSLATHDEEQPK